MVTVHTMAAYDLETQTARASAAIVLTKFVWNNQNAKG